MFRYIPWWPLSVKIKFSESFYYIKNNKKYGHINEI